MYFGVLADQKLKLIACDRHRLATRETNMDDIIDQQFNNIVISGRTLNELNKILPDQNSLSRYSYCGQSSFIQNAINFILFAYFGRNLSGYYLSLFRKPFKQN